MLSGLCTEKNNKTNLDNTNHFGIALQCAVGGAPSYMGRSIGVSAANGVQNIGNQLHH